MDKLRRTRAACLAAATLAACACSDGTPSRPPIEIVTPPPVRAVIAETSFARVDPDVRVVLEVQIAQRGVVDVTVDWTSPESWIYVYFGRTKCDYAQLAAGSCPFLVSSEAQTPKPRVLTTDTLDPGTYYLVLYNVPKDSRRGVGSDNTESLSVLMGLTLAAASTAPTPALQLGPPTIVGPRR